MSDIAIKVENLGKKYLIRHRQEGRQYKALRDVLTDKAKSLFRSGNRQGKPAFVAREEFWALEDISFEIKQGEAVGIIGRNGAGKSTLLKLVSRITEPSTGRLELNGRVASLLEVGTGFHPELTGRENIFLNGAVLGMKRTEIVSKFDEIVAFAEVERFLDTPVKRYSSGMYMRLAFAVAAHLEPEVLVIDEVLAVGDLAFQKKCLGKMEDVSKGGRTVIFVSHNMEAILRMCSRCLVLNKGKLEIDCAPKLAVEHYIAKRSQQDLIVDLRNAPRRWDPRQAARFATVRFVTSEGSRGWSIPYGEQFGLETELEVHAALEHLEIGVGIFTAGGTELTDNLSTEGLSLTSIKCGRYTFTINIEHLRLKPGTYDVLLWMRSDYGGEDYVYNACQFDVDTSELSSKHKTDFFNGLIIPEANYTFRRNDEPAS